MGLSSFFRKLRNGLLAGMVVGLIAVVLVRYRPVVDVDSMERSTPNAVFAFFERFELGFYDALAVEYARRNFTSADILFVRIDDESIREAAKLEGVGDWPWPRSLVGQMVEELHALGARLVVLDQIYVDRARFGDEDFLFAESLQRAKTAALGFAFSRVSAGGVEPAGFWAIYRGSYATRGAALLAAAPALAMSSHPYLVQHGERIEVWLGGYQTREEANENVARLQDEQVLGPKEQPAIRELKVSEILERVSREALLAASSAVKVTAHGRYNLNTFQYLQPPVAQLLATPATFGSVNSSVDLDGVVRSMRHLVRYEGTYYPSLALAAALRLTGQNEVTLADGRLKVGPYSIPIDQDGRTVLRYYGRNPKGERLDSPYEWVPAFNIIRSMAARAEKKGVSDRLAARVKDKIVFVSNDASALADLKPTPIYSNSVGTVAVANALDNLLRNDGLLRASTDFDSVVAFVMTLLGALLSMIFTRSTRMTRTAFLEMVAAALVTAAFLGWVSRSYEAGLWVGAAIPLGGFAMALIASTAINYADDAKTGNLVREALGKYTSPALVEQILHNPQYFALEGEQRLMTVYFSDIKDFTTISEGMKPKELVRLLNEYLTAMTEIVDKNRGQVDKFIGDAIMAYWGAPVPDPHHALHACKCALQMRDLLEKKRAEWKKEFGVEIYARAGVNTGEMVVGNMGSKGARQKVNYTVMGDSVNLGSRLEGTNKAYGTQILIGEGTFEATRGEVEVREIDLVRVKGKHRPVRIFELLALKGGIDPDAHTRIERFEEALVAYRRCDFKKALELLDLLGEQQPDDVPTQVYRKRCRAYLDEPPGEDWDGVFDLKDK